MLEPKQYPPSFGLGFFKSQALASAISKVPPDYWQKSTCELEQEFSPTGTLRALKYRYWSLISQAVESGEQMSLKQLHVGICTYTNLYNHVLANPRRLAWMVQVEPNASIFLEIVQIETVQKIRKLLEIELLSSGGRVNQSNANLLLKVMSFAFKLEDKITPNISARGRDDCGRVPNPK